MSRIDQRLQELGHVLPSTLDVAGSVNLPFAMVNIRGDRAFVAGHGPQNVDGTLAEPRGKVGAEVDIETGAMLARLTGLSMLASLKRELGDLDRIAGWGRVFGMVNSAPGFNLQPAVINGFTALIHDVFGPDIGRHARSAVGMAELPWNIAVEIEAEVLIRP